jgi:hypothetical protein
MDKCAFSIMLEESGRRRKDDLKRVFPIECDVELTGPHNTFQRTAEHDKSLMLEAWALRRWQSLMSGQANWWKIV